VLGPPVVKQNERSVLREAGAPEVDQAAAKQAALEARTAVGEALTELQLLTDDSRVLALADRIVDITFTLHEAPDRADRDRRPAPGRGHDIKDEDVARLSPLKHKNWVRPLPPVRRDVGQAPVHQPAGRPGAAPVRPRAPEPHLGHGTWGGHERRRDDAP
jgi:hypothetical protein